MCISENGCSIDIAVFLQCKYILLFRVSFYISIFVYKSKNGEIDEKFIQYLKQEHGKNGEVGMKRD